MFKINSNQFQECNENFMCEHDMIKYYKVFNIKKGECSFLTDTYDRIPEIFFLKKKMVEDRFHKAII
ncbi:hypothetical protein Glove_168g240 [Diversispora epigaea]|uniref:Uncharacterized protein n=1 Tax=Diversispora epigaea TaxID=1348612 RepID=A0A397ISL8_9GLOM|nr:hypothetical protein Glove_168g240 [Diversispora epigaea]